MSPNTARLRYPTIHDRLARRMTPEELARDYDLVGWPPSMTLLWSTDSDARQTKRRVRVWGVVAAIGSIVVAVPIGTAIAREPGAIALVIAGPALVWLWTLWYRRRLRHRWPPVHTDNELTVTPSDLRLRRRTDGGPWIEKWIRRSAQIRIEYLLLRGRGSSLAEARDTLTLSEDWAVPSYAVPAAEQAGRVEEPPPDAETGLDSDVFYRLSLNPASAAVEGQKGHLDPLRVAFAWLPESALAAEMNRAAVSTGELSCWHWRPAGSPASEHFKLKAAQDRRRTIQTYGFLVIIVAVAILILTHA